MLSGEKVLFSISYTATRGKAEKFYLHMLILESIADIELDGFILVLMSIQKDGFLACTETS